MPRPSLALLCALLAVPVAPVAAGCGKDAPKEPTRGVRIEVDAPYDAQVVDADHVELRGHVSPQRAEIRVFGRMVPVNGGAFSTDIPLEPGANVIDISGVAVNRRPTLMAVRVMRRMPVEVPDLQGEDAGTAVDRLRSLGLQVQLKRGGGFLDSLIPGPLGVCKTDPDAGAKLKPGSTVTVEVAKAC